MFQLISELSSFFIFIFLVGEEGDGHDTLDYLIVSIDPLPFILRSPVKYTLQESDSVRVFDNATLYQSTAQ